MQPAWHIVLAGYNLVMDQSTYQGSRLGYEPEYGTAPDRVLGFRTLYDSATERWAVVQDVKVSRKYASHPCVVRAIDLAGSCIAEWEEGGLIPSHVYCFVNRPNLHSHLIKCGLLEMKLATPRENWDLLDYSS